MSQTQDKKEQSEEKPSKATETKQEEIGGRDGPEPTRYGDWENKGKCVDF